MLSVRSARVAFRQTGLSMPGLAGTMKAHGVAQRVPRRGGLQMAPYVLVGEAWLGGWCWQDVAPHEAALQATLREELL